MNKSYPGVLVSSTNIQTFKLEGALPTGTIILVDWDNRSLSLEYPAYPDHNEADHDAGEAVAAGRAIMSAYPKGTLGDTSEKVLRRFYNKLEARQKEDRCDEPELPMGQAQTTTVDPTKDRKYIIMDADGWSHAPNGTGITEAQKKRNSPLVRLLKEVGKLIAKEQQPVCCFALANAMNNPGYAPSISGQLSQLFERGELRRQRYHCGCRGCGDVSDGRTLFHYQLMSGGSK